MKPIYFPFTYISKPVMEALSACFRQTVVYQPSGLKVLPELRKQAENYGIEIRIPVSGHEDNLKAVLKNYEDWTRLHQQGAVEYFKALSNQIPFFDETSSAQIRADIKDQSRPEPSQQETQDLLNARLFLHIAQDFDSQSDTIGRDLLICENLERDLFHHLKGENEIIQPVTSGKITDDPGLYMASERLKAWILLRHYDQEASGLYIATSRPVLDEVLDHASKIEMLIGFDAVPVCEDRTEAIVKWQDDLDKKLHLLQTNPWPPSSDLKFETPVTKGSDRYVALKLYMITGESPHHFFARCFGNKLSGAPNEKTNKILQNTIIGLIEF